MNAQALKDTIVELRREGRTIIFSTHVMENAERLCDALCIIANGEKVLDGPIASVKADHGGQYIAVALGDVSLSRDQRHLRRPLTRCHARRLQPHRGDRARAQCKPAAPASQTGGRRARAIERFELVQPSLHRIFIDTVGASGVEPGMSGHG